MVRMMEDNLQTGQGIQEWTKQNFPLLKQTVSLQIF